MTNHHQETPDLPTAGGEILSGHGEEVPDQTEGGLILSGHGEAVPDDTAGGEIIEGAGDDVADPDPDNREVDREHVQRGHDADDRHAGTDRVHDESGRPVEDGDRL